MEPGNLNAQAQSVTVASAGHRQRRPRWRSWAARGLRAGARARSGWARRRRGGPAARDLRVAISGIAAGAGAPRAREALKGHVEQGRP